MEAQQVIEKILADAKAEAEKIKQQVQEKLNAEQAKLDEQLDEYNKQTQTLAKKSAGDEKLHILAAARMDIAKQLLAEKRKILDEVFEQAQNRLKKLPDAEFRKLMTKLMLDAVEAGDEEVIVDKNEARIDDKFISQINQQLGPEKKGKLKLSSERENLGAGFILKRGKIKVNASIEVLLNQARRELEIELAKELFGD
jgi:V/A-type H+-transporting ATPase subunit E